MLIKTTPVQQLMVCSLFDDPPIVDYQHLVGGAAVLGRSDIGSLEPGKCADFVGLDTTRLEYAGGLHDLVAASVFCTPTQVKVNYVHGRPVVEDGQLVNLDAGKLIEVHNRAAQRLLAGS